MCRLVPIYLLTFFFSFSKELFKFQYLKRERVEKALIRKLVWLGKGGAKMYSNCIMPKPKAYSSRKYQKFHGVAKKLSCIDKKVWKMEAKWKAFCWGDHNLTPYNHFKNRPAWCDVKTHKRFECVFLITNWFWGEMAQLTAWHF